MQIQSLQAGYSMPERLYLKRNFFGLPCESVLSAAWVSDPWWQTDWTQKARRLLSYTCVTFFNVVVGPGHRTVSRAATCWAGRYPGPTISVTFASVFKTGRYWHGCAWVQLADWAQSHLYQCKSVYLPVLFSFIYRLCRSCKLLITPLLGPVLVGLRLAGRTTWLVVVSQVTATIDKSSLFTSSFMADICSTLVRI